MASHTDANTSVGIDISANVDSIVDTKAEADHDVHVRKSEDSSLLQVEDPFTHIENNQNSDEPLIKRLITGAVTGVGFLSDAFDLFIINVVMVIMEEVYPNIGDYKSGIATSVLVGAVFGQLLFGILADKIGRRIGFIITLLLVIIGSIASGLSFEGGPLGFNVFHVLMFWRFVLGVGVGGEYPLSATITAETSSTHSRGKKTAAVFSMQGVGSLLATLVGFLMYKALPNDLDIVWRASLGFGAIPGLSMLYFRIRMKETARFTMAKNNENAAQSKSPGGPTTPIRYGSSAEGDKSGYSSAEEDPYLIERSRSGFLDRLKLLWRETLEKFSHLKALKPYWKRLLGTAGCWFILDVTFYANGLFSANILKLSGMDESLTQILTMNIYLALAALPGYWTAIYLIEKLGRKRLQLGGFVVLSLVYLFMGVFIRSIEKSPAAFFSMYALTFFVTNAGPNTTTYVLPSESFPTEIRATAHGLSAAAGKIGATVGAAAMTPLLNAYGLQTVLIICAIVALSGAVHTFFFTVETSGKSLEQINENSRQ